MPTPPAPRLRRDVLRRGTLRRAVRVALVAAFVAAALGPATLRAQQAFSSLTFFGDSYSDNGNAYQLTGGAVPPAPPYYMGRFSNGPMWVDAFAQALGRPGDAAPAFLVGAASGNYAIGGARSGLTGNNGTPSGTLTQVGRYLTAHPAADPTGFYAVFAGGNDLRDAGALADPTARQAAAITAATNVLAEARALATAGAGNVMLFTLPSPGFFPEALGIPGRSAIDDELAATFNATLGAGFAGLEGLPGGTRFFDLRLDNLFTNIALDARAGGGRYGITNLTAPCFGPAIGFPAAPSCDVSLFVDDQHATTRGHALIAAAALRYVTAGQNVAVIPEPTPVLLVGAGVATLAGAAARRRRDPAGA